MIRKTLNQKEEEEREREEEEKERGERERKGGEKEEGWGGRDGRGKKDSNHTQLTAKGKMLGFYIA